MIDATVGLPEPASEADELLPALDPTPLKPNHPAPLDLDPYPAVRRITLTDRDCDLVARALKIVRSQCEAAAAPQAAAGPNDALATFCVGWLLDEITRVSAKFAPPLAPPS